MADDMVPGAGAQPAGAGAARARRGRHILAAEMVDHCGIRKRGICWTRSPFPLPALSPRHRVPDDSSRRQTPTVAPAVVADDASDITVRPLASPAECVSCVALQNEIWGQDYGDVPASILQVVARVGGIVAGAFAPDGELVGFVFGLPGLLEGEIVHWSHALGVRESARNAGVGRALKEYQRAELARRGIDRMYWSFDPLIAKNAHLNLNLLGARVVEYVRDMYGTTTSPLHHGLATDRVVVMCETSRDRARDRRDASRLNGRSPVLTPEPQHGDVLFATGDAARPPMLLLEIPTDMQLVASSTPGRGSLWHAAARRNFEWALHSGYGVAKLHRDPVTSRAFYVLELSAAVTAP